MKKLFLLSSLLVFFFTINAQPKIWSVSKDAAQKADYPEIQAAIDAASPGDYIYVYPSVYEDGFYVGIPVIIVGPGYFLGDNSDTQINKSPATVKGEVSIGTNTSGTIITGLNIENIVTIQGTSNVLIKRNRIHSMEINSSTNITVKQNFIYEDTEFTFLNPHIHTSVYVKNNSASIVFKNNFISATDTYFGAGKESTFLRSENTTSCTVENNVVYGNFMGYNITFNNNVSRAGENKGGDNCSFFNNISGGNQFGTANSNQANVSMTAVFVGSASNPSADGQWQLKNGSPAKGNGLNSTDCGMFGGTDPYVLSGIPDIPSITYFEAPDGASSADGLQVHIKIKSRK